PDTRPRAAWARRAVLGALPARLAAAHGSDRLAAPAHERMAALLPGRAGRPRWERVRDAQVPHAGARRRGTARALPRRGARPPDGGRDDRDRTAGGGGRAGR